MGKTISIINQKGGVGKTTTALNLSDALNRLGNRVLTVDLDPQANLTIAFGVKDCKKKNIAELFDEQIRNFNFQVEVCPVKESLDLIQGSLDLAGIETQLVTVMAREYLLQKILNDVKEQYDYIIIDCSPSLGLLTINAMAASDSVIIPSTPDFLAQSGMIMLMKTIQQVRANLNSRLNVEGVLVTMYNEKYNLHKMVSSLIEATCRNVKESFGQDLHVFTTKIPISVKAGESIANQQSVIEYDPENAVSKKYREFAKEVIGGKTL